jgi:hypothetical protein
VASSRQQNLTAKIQNTQFTAPHASARAQHKIEEKCVAQKKNTRPLIKTYFSKNSMPRGKIVVAVSTLFKLEEELLPAECSENVSFTARRIAT